MAQILCLLTFCAEILVDGKMMVLPSANLLHTSVELDLTQCVKFINSMGESKSDWTHTNSNTTQRSCAYIHYLYIDRPTTNYLPWHLKKTLAEGFGEISWIVISSFRDLRRLEILEIFVSLVCCWESLMCIIKQPSTNPTFISDIQHLTWTDLCVSMHRPKTQLIVRH